MRYVFLCDECQSAKEITRSIKEGPPKKGSKDIVCEECGQDMYQDLSGGSFILKGGGWPGKDIKETNNGGRSYAAAMNDIKIDHLNKQQEAVDQTMEARRRGRQASAEFKKKNPETWSRANDAMKEGVKPSKKADYAQIKKDMVKNAKKKLKKKDD